MLLALAGGYYLGNQSSSVQTTTEQQRDTHVETTKVVTKDPKTGAVTTTIVKDATSKTEIKSEVSIKDTKKNVINISGIVAYDLSNPRPFAIYGISVSKEVLGPITVGAFGLSNGVVGLTVGVDF